MSSRPGTAVWFAHHESRLAWRDWLAMLTAGRRQRLWKVAIGVGVFMVVMHAVAYSLVGRFAAAPPDKPMLVAITASLLLSWLLMVSQAMESMTRAFYSRADLDLILASPVAAHKLFAVRIATVALAVAMMAMPLALPFIDTLVVRGGPRWIGAYGVIVAMGAAAGALAVALTVALFRVLGPKRTRLVAQILAAVIGAAFVIGLQVAAILSYGTLSRSDVLQSDVVLAITPGVDSIFWWPARAALGEGQALVAVLASSFILLAAAIALIAPRFGDYAIAASAVANSTVSRARQPIGFRPTSPRRALRQKEWTLLRRDPWLVSQTLMQMLYLVPPALMLWRSFASGGGTFNLLVPVLVMAAGQLAGGLAWLTISGEDAPDLVATAPVRAALRPAGEGRSRARRHCGCVHAARRRAGRRLAVARTRHRLRDCRRCRFGDRNSALVPHPSQAQPVPAAPSLLARGHVCRGVFVDRLGGDGRGRRHQFVARHRAGLDRASPRRRRLAHQPARAREHNANGGQRSATSRTATSLTCSSAPTTSPVCPPICLRLWRANSAVTITSRIAASIARRRPRLPARNSTPRPTAAATRSLDGRPAWKDRPSLRAGGTKNISAGMVARAAACAAIKAAATNAGSARLASALTRMRSDMTSAHSA